MYKFFILCLIPLLVTLVSAKPAVIAPLAYSSPLVAASLYTTPAYTSSYYAPYTSPYIASSYTAAYTSYPFAASYLLR
ncbi:uncharacterized protein LOC119637991 [Glossina fuscipes]|uniref:Uncharacterized protein LOC119637991 n=1 Tax=Glossina fuscipes TaxID=7396 RepID=A0A9C5Z1X6_9MUSC|nr:uncharacterized protein LOC119637991 [Glossina fuscipes]